MMAAQEGHEDIVTFLIESGASVNQHSVDSSGCVRTPLLKAARWANAPIVAKLIHAGADVNLVVDDFGYTALMGAATSPCHYVGCDQIRLFGRQIEAI
jgi:ankyrin repeat protein